MHKPLLRKSGCIALTVFCVSIILSPAQAEMYVAGHMGMTVPRDTTQGELNGTGDPFADPTKSFPTSLSDLALKTSFVYGGKLGYYFNSVRELGVEVEGFNTTPHVKQQTAQLVQPGQDPVPFDISGNLRVTTAAVNLVARYPGNQFQPYVGVGVGAFMAHLKTPVDSSASTKPGLNVLAGLRYLLTEHIAVFGEWKYQHAVFNFDTTTFASAALPIGQANSLSGVKLHYNANMFTFGVSYHF